MALPPQKPPARIDNIEQLFEKPFDMPVAINPLQMVLSKHMKDMIESELLNADFKTSLTPSSYQVSGGPRTAAEVQARMKDLRDNEIARIAGECGIHIEHDRDFGGFRIRGEPLPGLAMDVLLTAMDVENRALGSDAYETLRVCMEQALLDVPHPNQIPRGAKEYARELIVRKVPPVADLKAVYRTVARWCEPKLDVPGPCPPPEQLMNIAWSLPSPLLAGILGFGECADAYQLSTSLLLILHNKRMINVREELLLSDPALQVRLGLMMDEIANQHPEMMTQAKLQAAMRAVTNTRVGPKAGAFWPQPPPPYAPFVSPPPKKTP